MNLFEGEEILFQGSCLYHKGLIAHPISFILTTKRLWVTVERFLDRLIGLRDMEIDLELLKGIQIIGIDRFVCIQTVDSTFRFSSGDSNFLYSHLQSHIRTNVGRREKRLTQDKCLYHRGVLAHPVDLLLTTEQMLFYGKRFADRFFGLRDETIPTRSIVSVEVKGIDKIVHLKTEKGLYKFSGSGALRLVPMFERIIKFFQESKISPAPQKIRPILAQGAIEVFVMGPLSVKGEFVLNRDELKVSSYRSLLTLIMGKVDVRISLQQGVKLLEGSNKKKLGIQYNGGSLWMGGNKVAVIHFFLNQMKTYTKE
jgi:hypothetical protein